MRAFAFLDSIAEITTPDMTLYLSFDDESESQVLEVERILGELADEGMVMGMEIYAKQ